MIPRPELFGRFDYLSQFNPDKFTYAWIDRYTVIVHIFPASTEILVTLTNSEKMRFININPRL